MKAIIWGMDRAHLHPAVGRLRDKQLLDPVCWFGTNANVVDVEYRKLQGSYIEAMAHDLIAAPSNIYEEIYKDSLRIIDLLQRNYRGYERNYHELVAIFNLYIDYFYTLVTKNSIELIIFESIPHEGADYVLYKIGNILNIRIITFNQALFKERFFCLNSIEDYGSFNDFSGDGTWAPADIEKKYEKNIFYMYGMHLNRKPRLPFIFKKIYALRNFLLFLLYFLSCRLTKANEYLHRYLLELNFLTNLSQSNAKLRSCERSKYVYFALHLQPEMTTSVIGSIYNDQILAIKKISEIIPSDWIIVVKENPKQDYFMRSNIFFERLALISKVRYVKNVSTYDLMSECEFVATVSGTVGWEAISGGKKVLVFGSTWYQNAPGVYKYFDGMTLNDILKGDFTHQELCDSINHIMSKTYCGIIDYDYSADINYFDDENNATKISIALEEILKKTNG